MPRIHRVQCVSPLGRVSDRAIARLAAAQQLVSFGVAKALLVLLRILVDPQHIPTELPGPLSADFGPPPHLKKNLTEDLKPRRPPEGGD